MKTISPLNLSKKYFSKKQFITFITLLVLVVLSISVQGTTYYVAPNGSDTNSGTESQPWKTIQNAANKMTAGDVTYIRAGTYHERVIPQNSGSAGNYITYAAFSGELVTIDGAGIFLPTDWGGLFDVTQKSYIKISGLKIMNAGPYDNNVGILIDNSSHITIEKNYIYNTVSSGIGVWESDNIFIDGNEVELACNDGEQECITVAETNIFEIKNNHVFNGGPGSMGGEGIDAKDGSANGKIYNNYVHDIPDRLGIYVEAWDKHTYNIEVFKNKVHDCSGDGITLASEQGGLLENISVYNNIIYNNRNVGITVTPNGDVPNPPMKNIIIINNTIYNNGWDLGGDSWGGGIGVDNPNTTNLIIRNNIVSQNFNFQIAIEASVQNLKIDFNLINGFRGELSEEVYGNDYVEADPKFVNISGKDLHLQSSSPAIDNGSFAEAPNDDFDGNPRPQGSGYDIGAFEYSQTGVESKKSGGTILNFELFQNYPNPFNPETIIEYRLPHASNVVISIFNVRGQKITTLIKNFRPAGVFQIKWDGTDKNGFPVANGVYLYQLKTGDFVSMKKMLLIQ